MPKNPNGLVVALVAAAALCLCLPAHARAQAVQPAALTSSMNETDRQRDGLQGPVRRVRTETAKLVYKAGKVTEGERATLETATYDMRGAKVDNAYFLSAGGALTGREVYKYDERGNIVEMTLLNADGSVMTKERYDYEFDAMGNWTKMVTSVALVENGETKFEPTEVTYRFISYFLQESVAQKLQPGQQSAPAPAAAAQPAPAPSVAAATPAVVNARASAKLNSSAPAAQQPQQQKAAAKPAALAKSPVGSGAVLVAPGAMPNAAPMQVASSGPLVKSDDDLPPPPRKAPVRPVSGGVLNGRALSLPSPAYPEAARRMQISGTVSVEVVIDVNGRVISAKATSGPAVLREAAERAAMQARFTPALLTGQPVKMSGTINYNFKL